MKINSELGYEPVTYSRAYTGRSLLAGLYQLCKLRYPGNERKEELPLHRDVV